MRNKNVNRFFLFVIIVPRNVGMDLSTHLQIQYRWVNGERTYERSPQIGNVRLVNQFTY